MEFVGIRSWSGSNIQQSLKHQALIFKRIAILEYSRILGNLQAKGDESAKDYISQLESLSETGIVFDPQDPMNLKAVVLIEGLCNRAMALAIEDHVKGDVTKWSKQFINLGAREDYSEYMDLYLKHSDLLHKKLEQATKALKGVTERLSRQKTISLMQAKEAETQLKEVEMLMQEAETHKDMTEAADVRRVSIQLRELDHLDAIPILLTSSHFLNEEKAKKADVIKITLNALPVPSETISWEQILDYRSDPDSESKFLALRRWMSKVIRDGLTPTEIQEELEDLIYQYEAHMNLHRIKTNAGTLETFLTVAAESVENLLKGNLSKSVKTAFALKHRKIALMEAEASAPGKEIAYIIKTKNTFS